MENQKITCPECNATFPVTEALTGEIEDRLRKEWEKDAEQEKEKYETEFQEMLKKSVEEATKKASKDAKSEYDAEVADLEKELKATQKEVEKEKKSFEQRVAGETVRLEKEAKKAANETASSEITDLKNKLQERSKKIRELEEASELLDEKGKKLEAREKKLEATVAKEVNKAVAEAKKKAMDETAEEFESQIMQKDKKLGDLSKQVGELKRQLEQSSQQLQGEVYELHLEKLLRSAFPDDEIVEVPKGKTGADIIQRVYAKSGVHAGVIVWESKNTKSFYKSWIKKLKTDQRREKAEIAVLATTALPKDFKSRFGLQDGVWITDFTHAVALATSLRENIIQLNSIRMASVSKEEKLEVIYQYLTGVEFKHRVEAIVEAFGVMQEELNKEKIATQRNWNHREEQLQAVLQNVAGMYGEFQALAGKALPKIKKLDLLPPPAD